MTIARTPRPEVAPPHADGHKAAVTDATTDRARAALRWAAFAAALALFAWSLRDADLTRVSALVRRVGPGIVVILLPYLVAMCLDVAGWRTLLAELGHHVPFAPFLGTRLAAEAVLQSVPGGQVVAEAMAPVLLRDRAALPLPVGYASLALKKSLFSLAHGLVIAGGAVAGFGWLTGASTTLIGRPWAPWLVLGSGALVSLASAATLVALVRGSVLARALGVIARVPHPAGRRTRILERWREAVGATDGHMGRLATARPQAVLRALAAFVAFWLLEALETWLLLRLLGARLGFDVVLSFEAAVALLRSLAFFVPAGMGVQDLSYLAFLRAAGIDDVASVGPAFVLAKRAKELFWIAVGYALLLGRGRAAART